MLQASWKGLSLKETNVVNILKWKIVDGSRALQSNLAATKVSKKKKTFLTKFCVCSSLKDVQDAGDEHRLVIHIHRKTRNRDKHTGQLHTRLAMILASECGSAKRMREIREKVRVANRKRPNLVWEINSNAICFLNAHWSSRPELALRNTTGLLRAAVHEANDGDARANGVCARGGCTWRTRLEWSGLIVAAKKLTMVRLPG